MSNPSGPDENTEPEADAQRTGNRGLRLGRGGRRAAGAQVHRSVGVRRGQDPDHPCGLGAGDGDHAHDGGLHRVAAATGPAVAPQAIPGRVDPPPIGRRRSWGWVVALVLVIAALAAVAILGTVLLTRDDPPAVSQEDLVRTAIQGFDTAIQNGDLSALRTITCGETADSYLRYDDEQWTDIHSRVAAARQYPVVASIDEVVVNDGHAEANVTSFMAFDPATRSTRSFDLEFRDEQWKICQAPQ